MRARALLVLLASRAHVAGTWWWAQLLGASGRALADAPEQSPALGFAAFIVAAVCTSFASVFFEKMLKGASKPSLWLRNIQLATYSTVIACVGLVGQRGVAAALSPSTLLAGFDHHVLGCLAQCQNSAHGRVYDRGELSNAVHA